jgi:hypothetical protein
MARVRSNLGLAGHDLGQYEKTYGCYEQALRDSVINNRPEQYLNQTFVALAAILYSDKRNL